MTRIRGEWLLPGSVKPYHRHFAVCTGSIDWPARIEEQVGLLGQMARDVRERREKEAPVPKLTAIDERSASGGLDVLVFPDGVRYRSVGEREWEAIVEDHVDGGRPSARVRHDPVIERYVLVCVHGARDERCGRCGPGLVRAFRQTLRDDGVVDVVVRATSHVGGHKYAGNVLVYPGGVWYGYVSPEDAPRIVREHLISGSIVEDLYRGSMETE